MRTPRARKSVALLAAIALCAGCGGGGGSAGSGSGGMPPGPAPGIALLAGDPVQEGSTDAAGAAARFSQPAGIAVDAAGNVYVADMQNHTIRKISAAGTVTTLAGAAGVLGEADGLGGTARFAKPAGLAIDSAGNLLVADSANLLVRKVSPAGLVTTVATIPAGHGNDGRSIGLMEPGAIAVDPANNLIVTNLVGTRKIGSAGSVSIIEGVDSVDNTFGSRFIVPRGVAADSGGNIYVVNLGGAISKAAPGGALAPFAGTAGVSGSADGSGAAASFNQPRGLAADGKGNVYVADTLNYTLRKITPAGLVSTVAGVASVPGVKTGPLPGGLAGATAVALDANGIVYLTSGNAVLKVTLPAQ
ncbi:MAG TPA: hypothetical protein VFG03_00440 [Telluria sp.]|nr:hypothetical protein [Telluria sp.]